MTYRIIRILFLIAFISLTIVPSATHIYAKNIKSVNETLNTDKKIPIYIREQRLNTEKRIIFAYPNNVIPKIHRTDNLLLITFPLPLEAKTITPTDNNLQILTPYTIAISIPKNTVIEVKKKDSQLVLTTYEKPQPNKEIKLALNFINTDIKTLAAAISEAVGINIVVDPEAKGKVTINFKKQTNWTEAFKAAIEPLGLVLIDKKNYYYLVPKIKLQREEMKNLKTYVFTLKYANVKEVANKLGRLFNIAIITYEGNNETNPQEQKSSQSKTSSPNNNESITTTASLKFELFSILEENSSNTPSIVPKETEENAPTTTLSIESILDYHNNPSYKNDISNEKINFKKSYMEAITYIEETNQIIIRTTEKRIEEIKKVLDELDKPRKQVLVKAKVIQINSNAENSLGISWFISGYNRYEDKLNSTYIAGSYGFNIENYSPLITPDNYMKLSSIPVSDSTLALAILNKSQTLKTELAIKAMELEGKAQIISSPQILTFENRTAFIEQGIEIPYTETTTHSSGATETTVKFKRASLILGIKPRVISNKKILLEIVLKKDTPNFNYASLSNSKQPAIDTRSIVSQVIIRSGNSIAIGGIVEKEKFKSTKGIPILSHIPLIDWLFKTKYERTNKTQLIIIITPEIINEP